MENNRVHKDNKEVISFEEFVDKYKPLAAPYGREGFESLLFDRNDLHLLSKELQDRKVWSLIRNVEVDEFTQNAKTTYSIISSKAAIALYYITTEMPWQLGNQIEVPLIDVPL